jgi:uroporphyrinogen-III synthase
MRLLVTRALEDASKLAAALKEDGHDPLLAPLLEIRDRANASIPLDGVVALLFTSANGVRAFARQSKRRDIAAFAVGPATGAAARAVGFTRIDIAEGDVAALTAHVRHALRPEAGAIVHVSGSDVAGDLAGDLERTGYKVKRAVIYEAAARDRLPLEVVSGLTSGTIDGVLLFSPRTAQIFVDLIQKAGLGSHVRSLVAFCLAGSVAAALQPLSFGQILVADQPHQAALIDLLARVKR